MTATVYIMNLVAFSLTWGNLEIRTQNIEQNKVVRSTYVVAVTFGLYVFSVVLGLSAFGIFNVFLFSESGR